MTSNLSGRSSPTSGGWFGPFKTKEKAIHYLHILEKERNRIENRVDNIQKKNLILVGKQTVGYYPPQKGWFIMPAEDFALISEKKTT